MHLHLQDTININIYGFNKINKRVESLELEHASRQMTEALCNFEKLLYHAK